MSIKQRAPVAGSYLLQLGMLMVSGDVLRSMRRRPCPVCCAFLGRDRDMIIVEKHNVRFWLCESGLQIEDLECGYAFPAGMSEARINVLARIRGRLL